MDFDAVEAGLQRVGRAASKLFDDAGDFLQRQRAGSEISVKCRRRKSCPWRGSPTARPARRFGCSDMRNAADMPELDEDAAAALVDASVTLRQPATCSFE